MSLSLLIIILVVLMALAALLVVLLAVGSPFGSKKQRRQTVVSDSLRTMVMAQRNKEGSSGNKKKSKESLALAAAAEAEITRKKTTGTSKLTLEKRLRYGRWPMTPLQYRAIEVSLCIICFLLVYALRLSIIWKLLSPFIGIILLGTILNKGILRRFKQFDQDYPVLLLSYVSLLKTGMTTISGLEAAAKGLDEGSLVRAEVELLVERLKLGLTEEQAINSFGEDIAHPELELFVQCLLLSRRVGGQLSSTLERLARQVRKRQEFRQKAVAAVGMERSSLIAIAVIMSLLMFYLAYNSPELVWPALKHPVGNMMFQSGFALIMMGFYWMKTVTNIKV